MCVTDEKAIRTLPSLCKEQINLLVILPKNLIKKIKKLKKLKKLFKNIIKPNLPNFNINPAKTILPILGASVCALGSHKWKKKIGILIIKLKIKKKEKTNLISFNIKKFDKIIVKDIIIIKGILLTKVYKKK